MGCDIHMIAEKKSKYDYDTAGWEPMLTPIFKDRWYCEAEPLNDYNKPYTFQPYDDRNYVLFAVLAGVRNGYDIEPISEPRDYPGDMHDVSKWLLAGYDFVDHSPTWLTLEEVLAFPWDSKFTRGGMVKPDEYAEYKEVGKPQSWCAAASGGNVEYISNTDMEAVVAKQETTTKSYYTGIKWDDTFGDVCKDFLANMEVLKAYAERENCDIRLVFGFDN